MGHRNHLNAAELLPEEELRKLSDLLDGRSAYLWVPSRDSLNRRRRGDYIVALRRKGISVTEIARRLNLSERHVQRILAKKRTALRPPPRGMNGTRRTPHEPLLIPEGTMKPEELEQVTRYLASLAGENFFGRVTIAFQNGRVNTVKTEILKRLDELEIPPSAGQRGSAAGADDDRARR